ncbi:MAG TPA: WXG100 family type VII secretion target [Acidimicrobiia bacterium]|jgi:uncharacterized protein YukE|nr:WXG100 family type VII secretion target [Acidimicrobiia bacterium]
MSNMFGANLEQLDQLQRRFVEENEAVRLLQTRISGTLGSTAWTGPAAERFRSAWSGEFVPALNRLAEALAENASVVANRREAIAVATG